MPLANLIIKVFFLINQNYLSNCTKDNYYELPKEVFTRFSMSANGNTSILKIFSFRTIVSVSRSVLSVVIRKWSKEKNSNKFMDFYSLIKIIRTMFF